MAEVSRRQVKTRTLMGGIAALAVVVAVVSWLVSGRGPLPLDRSPFLSGVVEPITIVYTSNRTP
jgi:hypothetical protein